MSLSMARILLVFCLASGTGSLLRAQQGASMTQPTTGEISEIQRKSLQDLANDIPQLQKYREANRALGAPERSKPRIVFFGDSLTEGWGMTQRNGSHFFPDKPNYINRGISGQTTLQMLVRFRQDVLDLHPAVVLILAGTNDLAGNMGPSSLQMITDNLQSMVELSLANHIQPVICSVLPAKAFRWRPDIQPAESIRTLNQWLKSYATSKKLVYVDYYSVLATPDGAMQDGMAWDGVHPLDAGYQRMKPLAEDAIAKALLQPSP